MSTTFYGTATLDKKLFQSCYRDIVAAYDRFLPAGSGKNPEPALRPESLEACWAAELHRQFWRPAELKFALVAESHVYTDADDETCAIQPERLPAAAMSAPRSFVRLIYCLGYGDSTLLSGSPRQANGTDTPFWNLFARAAGMEKTPSLTVGNKVHILTEIKRRGVWLADASIHSCMNPRFGKEDRRRNIGNFKPLYRAVLAASWRYVMQTIAGAPTVWVIGKGVYDTLCNEPAIGEDKWVYQPGSRVQDGERMRKLEGSLLTVGCSATHKGE